MEEEIYLEEKKYLSDTIDLVNIKLNKLEKNSENLQNTFSESNEQYFEYLKDNANKMNENDVVEIVNLQSRLDDIQEYSGDLEKEIIAYKKMLSKPYFARIDIKDQEEENQEKYYIGLHSLVNDKKEYITVDWRSPIASIFYDYEQGECRINTNSSILRCELLAKRQYGIESGKLNYYIDSTINIEDNILQEALANNTTNQMKSIIQTIQKEQNTIIRGDENKNLIVQGVAGSGKTAIALHRIAYLLYKMKGKISSKDFNYITPNNAFSSYISSVLPDLAEEDIEKIQLDSIARAYLKRHLILEKKHEQIERLIDTNDLSDYKYKSSYKFLQELLEFANKNYIDNFDLEDFEIKDKVISSDKIKQLFFNRYKDRDLFTRIKWITDNVFDMYFFKVKNPDRIVRLKQVIFLKIYESIDNKNCVRAYMNFLETKNKKLQLIDNKVKNEDAYAILFFKSFIYGLDKFENIKHVVIDEMQDYSAVQLYILSYLYDCPKTVLGDYNQTLLPNTSKDLQSVMQSLFGGENSFIELNKSYRSTMEIANVYNKLRNDKISTVVSRHGDDVNVIALDKNKLVDSLLKLIEEYKNKGYRSIAIITKTNNDARNLFELFENSGVSINLIDDNIDLYDNKECIISAYNSKGLEFDGVIVYNVSDGYNSEIDRNLLYIALTRALHKLTITYVDKPSELIKNL